MVKSLRQLRDEARGCRDCPLWANATQTVFGAGDPHARVMLVGEQPGDEEDRQGLPFVGPAGRLLDRALQEAGVDREHVYITNAVKHFKWQPAGGRAGKRRLHKTPAQREIDACRQWIEGEIRAIEPAVIVCLGATAARALLGRDFKVSLSRGKLVKTAYAPFAFATYHPSALLRLREAGEREAAFRQLVEDLSLIRKALGWRGAREAAPPSAPRPGRASCAPPRRRASASAPRSRRGRS